MEVWEDLIGYDNKYQVSNLGNVRLKENNKILKQYNCKGYKYVTLNYENKYRNVRVHRLIAKAFLNDYSEDCIVMHLDNNPQNNKIENCTQKENIQQCYKQGRMCFQRKKVKQFDKKGNFIKIWNTQTEIQSELGYRQNFISACCNGKKKSAYGYRWELVSDE